MIRVVLVRWSDADWRVFRQEQWMAEVRRAPEASRFPRYHFDIDEDIYRSILTTWDPGGHGSGRDGAFDRLKLAGAVEVTRGPSDPR